MKQPDRTPNQYVIRPARLSDLDSLEELLLALQQHLESSNPDLWRPRSIAQSRLRTQLAARLSASQSCALVAEHVEDGVVGVILGRITSNHRYVPSRSGVVDQLFVQSGHRRAGVGSRLVAGLCCFFGDAGVDALSLRYVVGNREAASFWAALGFAPRIVVAGAERQAVERRLAEGPPSSGDMLRLRHPVPGGVGEGRGGD